MQLNGEEKEKTTEEKEEKTKKTQGKTVKKRVWIAVLSVFLAVFCFFGGFFTYSWTLDKEMRSLIWAKKKIQSEYNYEITDEEFYEAMFDAVESLLDPYSEYLTEKEYRERLQESTGRWSGMGLRFLTADEQGESQLLVVKVSGNSPAERLGITVGTQILGYGKKEEEIVRDTDYQKFSDFILERQEKEDFFLLIKDGKTGEERVCQIAKENFIENYVFYRTGEKSYAFTGEKADKLTETGNPLSCLSSDTAYIRLTQFNGRAAKAFDSAMSLFKQEKKQRLVLDLRGNGGGDMEILKEIAKYFCKTAQTTQPTIAKAYYRNGRKQSFRAPANLYYEYFSETSKICVLADNDTASASECLIGCMVDYGAIGFGDIYLAERFHLLSTKDGIETVYETKTYGKGIMQTTFPRTLFGSEAIKLTTASIVWPISDTCIHGVGVTQEQGAQKIPYGGYTDVEIERAVNAFYTKA